MRKPKPTAAPAPQFVRMTIRLTPTQANAIREAAAELRAKPEDFIVAAACSEIGSWGSLDELVSGLIPELIRFVDERETPQLPQI